MFFDSMLACMETFGERLRRLRDERSLSVSRLASSAGVTEGAIRQMELGYTKSASFPVGVKLARALGVSPMELALGEAGIVNVDEAEDLPQGMALSERLNAIEAQIAILPPSNLATKANKKEGDRASPDSKLYISLIYQLTITDIEKEKLASAFDELESPQTLEENLRFQNAAVDTLRAVISVILDQGDNHNNSFGHIGTRLNIESKRIDGLTEEIKKLKPASNDVWRDRLSQQNRALARVLRAAFAVLDLQDTTVEEVLSSLERQA
jgi:transcriptional regulator with XRE-family HTH domain